MVCSPANSIMMSYLSNNLILHQQKNRQLNQQINRQINQVLFHFNTYKYTEIINLQIQLCICIVMHQLKYQIIVSAAIVLGCILFVV